MDMSTQDEVLVLEDSKEDWLYPPIFYTCTLSRKQVCNVTVDNGVARMWCKEFIDKYQLKS